MEKLSVTQASITIQRLAYSVDQTAEITSLSKGYLRKDIRAGRLKATRFGRRVLILSEDLDAYLRKQDR